MSLYTLDTNVIAAVLRGEEAVVANLEKRVGAGELVTLNAIAYFETRRGLTPQFARKRALFERLVAEAGVLELDRIALDVASNLYQELRQQGALLEDADILIAGIALAHDAVLVTRNLRHFARVPELRLENWEEGN